MKSPEGLAAQVARNDDRVRRLAQQGIAVNVEAAGLQFRVAAIIRYLTDELGLDDVAPYIDASVADQWSEALDEIEAQAGKARLLGGLTPEALRQIRENGGA